MAKITTELGKIEAKLRWKLTILIVALLIFGVVLPLLLCLAFISVILRTFVLLVARRSRPDLDQVMSGAGVFMALESVYRRPKNVILINLICDGELNLTQLQSTFQQRILNYRDQKGNLPYAHFRQRWTPFSGFLFWQSEEKFSLEKHIRLYDYTEPELALPNLCTEEDLKRIVGPLLSQPFRQGQSPWEVLIIPNYRSADDNDSNAVVIRQAVIVLRVHHALGDGVGLLKVLLKWTDSEVNAAITIPQPKFPKMSSCQRCISAVLMPLRLPFDVAAQICSSNDGPNSWHLVGTKLSRKYLTFCCDAIPVGTIKEIKNKHGVAYNEAVFAVLLGGIRRLMLEAGQEVPEEFSCFVPMPLPNHPGGLAIHVSGFSITFRPRTESPTERLQQVSAGFRILRRSPALLGFLNSVCNLCATLPPMILRLIYNQTMVTLAMTSLPGPEQCVDVLGTAKCVGGFTALGHAAGNTGAVAALASLAGKQRMVLTVDRDIFRGCKIPQNFVNYINYEVQALLLAQAGSRINTEV